MNLNLLIIILPLTIWIEGKVYKTRLIKNPYKISLSLNVISTSAMLFLYLIPDIFLDNYGIDIPTPESILRTIKAFPDDNHAQIFLWLGPFLIIFYAISALFAVGLERICSKLLYKIYKTRIPLAAIIKANLISATLSIAYFFQYFSVV